MKRTGILLFFLFAGSVLFSGAKAQHYVVTDFGAKGQGTVLETANIQKAIDKAAENGGGIVEVPAGVYKIGTLILRDNVNLHLQAGAVLSGSPDYRDYTEVTQHFESRTRDLYAKYFMIFAEGAGNISITGRGIIYGNGDKNFQVVRPQNLRPYMIRLVNCRNVTLRDVQLLESANWTLHLLGCRDVNIDGIVIRTTGKGNRDGLDIDACQRVTVANSRISTTDDAIVMKASCDSLCQDIAITNCQLSSEASAIKTGTESNGGFRNISISNCVIRDIPVHTGIELMTVDGGMMQNIVVENITMVNVATPFFIRLGLRLRPYKYGQYVKKVDPVQDIQLNNISVENAKLPSSIMGLHHMDIKNVTVTNYTVRYVSTQQATPYNQVPLEEFSYPAASEFKNLPAYALYCRNVEGLYLENLTLYSAKNEKRAACVFDRVSDLKLLSVKAEVRDPEVPLAHYRNAGPLVATLCSSMGDSRVLFETEEATCHDLTLFHNLVQKGQEEVKEVKAVPDGSPFYDFPTDIKYSVEKGEKIKGLTAHDLAKGPLKVDLTTTRNRYFQLCLLILNDSEKPEKVKVFYDGKSQEFRVNWNRWGWAPVTIMKKYEAGKNVEFEIRGAREDSHLKVAKVYVRYLNIAYTD